MIYSSVVLVIRAIMIKMIQIPAFLLLLNNLIVWTMEAAIYLPNVVRNLKDGRMIREP